jgi:hypothetical protein
MAETEAITGKGLILSYGDDADGTDFTEIAEVTDCGLPEFTFGTAEATHYQSPDNTVEKISIEWKEWTDIPFTFNFVAAQYAAAVAIGGIKKYFKIGLANGAYWVGPAQLGKMGGGTIPNKDVIKVASSLTVMGKWDFHAS